MSSGNPTRAALLELHDERHAMREGYVFLDEKCLLLAGEMLRQLQRHAALQATLAQANERALRALQAAVARHGLQGLQVQPAADTAGARVACRRSALMGVALQDAQWNAVEATAPASIGASPELHACRRAFAAFAAAAVPLAAVAGNLQRLSQEYRRSVRRARALQDVLLPTLEREVADIQTRLEELEQQDVLAMRHHARPFP
jgi:V/A-type H+-transporting ATPase subunit D